MLEVVDVEFARCKSLPTVKSLEYVSIEVELQRFLEDFDAAQS